MNSKKILSQRKALMEMYKQGFIDAYMFANPRLKNKEKAWKKISEDCLESFHKNILGGI